MHALAGLKLFLTIDDCHDICKRYDIMFYCHGPVRKKLQNENVKQVQLNSIFLKTK